MSQSAPPLPRRTRLANRLAAWRATLGRPTPTLVYHPEPRSIGLAARGRQLCEGVVVLAGRRVEAPGATIWDIDPPDAGFAAGMHGFGWLDDLAAAGDRTARATAQAWLAAWIARYGRGGGPGWTPELAGRRLMRWTCHAEFLLRGQDAAAQAAVLRSLAQQTRFVARRWRAARPGRARVEALTGLLHAGVSLEGMVANADAARAALAQEAPACLDATGGPPDRNPEALLELFMLLTASALLLSDTGRTATDAQWRTIERIAPGLRTLRHADGGLARFHGGGRGREGRLDAALAASGVKARAKDGRAMGYARLSRGRTSVIVDAAPPPGGAAGDTGHASTLAFELTSGRRPLIVNCGAGAEFGPDWRRAGRATPSHSALVLDGGSSARLGHDPRHPERLAEAPRDVSTKLSHPPGGPSFEGAHDGYLRSHGLTHVRRLDLSADGRTLTGEDMLLALGAAQEARFDRAFDATRHEGVPFDIRFHLHPDVQAAASADGAAMTLTLRSGEVWEFRGEGAEALALNPSVYLETTRPKPRATRQIVLSGRATHHATHIRWSLAKTASTPVGIRDVAPDAPGPETDD